jgi:CBS domain-containing protein
MPQRPIALHLFAPCLVVFAMETLSTLLRLKDPRPLLTIDADRTVMEAVAMMNDHSVGALIVTLHGRMCGIFTERDILRRVLGQQRLPTEVLIRDVMTAQVIVASPQTSIDEARGLMKTQRIRHLPVVDAGGELVGLISIGDLNAYLTVAQEEEIHLLNQYLHGRV